MNKLISRGLWTVLLVGGLSVAGASAAHAAETSGDGGTASGTQADVGLTLPITIGGNAISVLGTSAAPSAGEPAQPITTPAAPPSTSGVSSLLGGTQALVDAVIPITVSDNAISVLGQSASSSQSSAPVTSPDAATPATDPATTGDDSILGGTQLTPRISVPVTVQGNAISVLGSSASTSGPAPSSEATDASGIPAIGEVGIPIRLLPGGTSSGDDSILGGSQLLAGISIPITVGGNAIGVLGDSTVSPGSPGESELIPGITPDTTTGTVPAPSEPTIRGGAVVSAALAVDSLATLPVTGANTGGLWWAGVLSLIGLALAACAGVTRHGVTA